MHSRLPQQLGLGAFVSIDSHLAAPLASKRSSQLHERLPHAAHCLCYQHVSKIFYAFELLSSNWTLLCRSAGSAGSCPSFAMSLPWINSVSSSGLLSVALVCSFVSKALPLARFQCPLVRQSSSQVGDLRSAHLYSAHQSPYCLRVFAPTRLHWLGICLLDCRILNAKFIPITFCTLSSCFCFSGDMDTSSANQARQPYR